MYRLPVFNSIDNKFFVATLASPLDASRPRSFVDVYVKEEEGNAKLFIKNSKTNSKVVRGGPAVPAPIPFIDAAKVEEMRLERYEYVTVGGLIAHFEQKKDTLACGTADEAADPRFRLAELLRPRIEKVIAEFKDFESQRQQMIDDSVEGDDSADPVDQLSALMSNNLDINRQPLPFVLPFAEATVDPRGSNRLFFGGINISMPGCSSLRLFIGPLGGLYIDSSTEEGTQWLSFDTKKVNSKATYDTETYTRATAGFLLAHFSRIQHALSQTFEANQEVVAMLSLQNKAFVAFLERLATTTNAAPAPVEAAPADAAGIEA